MGLQLKNLVNDFSKVKKRKLKRIRSGNFHEYQVAFHLYVRG